MQTTTNYQLKVYEGEDLFNPLTVENANTREIDNVLKQNADNGIWTANHIKANSIHEITRNNPDARMFTFQATSRFEVGDSFVVDGVSVTALMPNGASLPDGVFIIGSIVLCSLVGQMLTIYSVGVALANDSEKLGGQLPAYYAKQSDMTETKGLAESASELANNNARDIIDIKDTITGIGEIVEGVNSESQEAENNTNKVLASITLDPGTYVVWAKTHTDGSRSGTLITAITTSESSYSAYQVLSKDDSTGMVASSRYVNDARILNVTTRRSYYYFIKHTFGSKTNFANTVLQAIRIK